MRFLVKFHIPVETGNALIRTGKIQEVMRSMLAELKPEVSYFMPEHGCRSGLLVIQAQDN